jgi:hypothetical protein
LAVDLAEQLERRGLAAPGDDARAGLRDDVVLERPAEQATAQDAQLEVLELLGLGERVEAARERLVDGPRQRQRVGRQRRAPAGLQLGHLLQELLGALARQAERRLALEHLAVLLARLLELAAILEIEPAGIGEHGLDVDALHLARRDRVAELGVDRGRQLADQLLLEIEQPLGHAADRRRGHVDAGRDVGQPRVDPELRRDPEHRARDDIARPHQLADPGPGRRIERARALQSNLAEHRLELVALDDRDVVIRDQIGDDHVGEPLAHHVVLGLARQVVEVHHHHHGLGRGGGAWPDGEHHRHGARENETDLHGATSIAQFRANSDRK